MNRFISTVFGLVLGLASGYAVAALAARSSTGTYSLPTGNPVVGGTTITSTWANNTLADIKTELTDSLSRSSKGGMTGQLACVDGSASAPGISFNNDKLSGLYLAGTHDVRMSVNNGVKQAWGLSTSTIYTGLSVMGATALTGSLSVAGTVGGAITANTGPFNFACSTSTMDPCYTITGVYGTTLSVGASSSLNNPGPSLKVTGPATPGSSALEAFAGGSTGYSLVTHGTSYMRASSTGDNALEAIGGASGYGVYALGGTSGGAVFAQGGDVGGDGVRSIGGVGAIGVRAEGGSGGAGVRSLGGSGAPGVLAIGGGGPGGEAAVFQSHITSIPTAASVQLVPLDTDPTSANLVDGDLWTTTEGLLRARLAGTTVTAYTPTCTSRGSVARTGALTYTYVDSTCMHCVCSNEVLSPTSTTFNGCAVSAGVTSSLLTLRGASSTGPLAYFCF